MTTFTQTTVKFLDCDFICGGAAPPWVQNVKNINMTLFAQGLQQEDIKVTLFAAKGRQRSLYLAICPRTPSRTWQTGEKMVNQNVSLCHSHLMKCWVDIWDIQLPAGTYVLISSKCQNATGLKGWHAQLYDRCYIGFVMWYFQKIRNVIFRSYK